MTHTPDRPDPAAPDVVEIRQGRRPPPKTEIYDWVPLAVRPSTGKPIRGEAVKLYDLIKMHVNRKRGDDQVFASTLALAKLMGYSRGDKISGYLAELAEIEAIDIIRGGVYRWGRMYRCNVYVVHSLPPAGYTGITSLGMWYRANKRELATIREAEKDTRDMRRAAKKAGTGTDVSPPNGGDSPAKLSPPNEGDMSPRNGGDVSPPNGGDRSPPFEGGNLVVAFEPAAYEPPPPTGSSTAAGPPGRTGPEQREQEQCDSADGETPVPPRLPAHIRLSAAEVALCTELAAGRPDWSPVTIGEVLADPRIRSRSNRDLVAAAFRKGVAAGEKTSSPRRLLHDACPHWAQAARELYGDLGAPPDLSGRFRARQSWAPWCGSPLCDQTTRQMLDQDGRPKAGADGWMFCPVCSPYRRDPDPLFTGGQP